jgi:hypothetical protein
LTLDRSPSSVGNDFFVIDIDLSPPRFRNQLLLGDARIRLAAIDRGKDGSGGP